MRPSRSSVLAIAVVAVAAGLLALAPMAQTENGVNAQYKIGVVDIKEVFDNYEKQKTEYQALQKKRDKAQNPIDALSAMITKDKERYDAEKESMGEDERRLLEEKIESALTRYRAEFERAQEDINRQEKKLVRDILQDIYLAVQEVGAKYNYHLIFESGQNNLAGLTGRNGGLIYSSTPLNMTQRVLDHLNDKESN